MRVLFTVQPGIGHWHPLAPFALAAQRAGHVVAVACAASFRPTVAADGIETFVAGLDWLQSRPEEAFPEMVPMSALERGRFFTEIFADITAHPMATDLLQLCAEWQPDLLVRDMTEYGACAVGERLGIPHVAIGLELFAPDYMERLVLEERLAYLRTAVGLPPYPALDMLYRHLLLSQIPRSYQFPNYQPPATLRVVRSEAGASGASAGSAPGWLATLPKRPTVYISLGTVFNRALEVYGTLLAGLAAQPWNIIITVGHSVDPQALGAVPDNVYIERYVPQQLLMPYCDVVISHGGGGTILLALKSGVPTLVIPLVPHLTLHAIRCQALHVGLAMRPPDWVPEAAGTLTGTLLEDFLAQQAAPFSAESAQRLVTDLLTDGSYRAAARAIQAEIAQLPDVAEAIHWLEALVAGQAPA